ncbi:uncharacterized protein LOC134370775 [Cynocephalus volans]|uniref:uncharacterized protein LOC134370775 n=1 Tax=Cynocephalus volans TaxID=110931 RepID=UPI002FCBE18B
MRRRAAAITARPPRAAQSPPLFSLLPPPPLRRAGPPFPPPTLASFRRPARPLPLRRRRPVLPSPRAVASPPSAASAARATARRASQREGVRGGCLRGNREAGGRASGVGRETRPSRERHGGPGATAAAGAAGRAGGALRRHGLRHEGGVHVKKISPEKANEDKLSIPAVASSQKRKGTSLMGVMMKCVSRSQKSIKPLNIHTHCQMHLLYHLNEATPRCVLEDPLHIEDVHEEDPDTLNMPSTKNDNEWILENVTDDEEDIPATPRCVLEDPLHIEDVHEEDPDTLNMPSTKNDNEWILENVTDDEEDIPAVIVPASSSPSVSTSIPRRSH